MADEKKKKLELLKQRNEANRNKLTTNNTNTSTSSLTTNTTSFNSVPSSTATLSTIDQLIKETSKAPADINLDEIKRATKRMNKSAEEFFISKMSQTILAVIPDVYEDGVQCKLDEDQFDSDVDEEEQKSPKEKGSVSAGYRKSVIFMSKAKKGALTSNASNKKTDIGSLFLNEDKLVGKLPFDKTEENINIKSKTTITEDMRRQILTSQELGDFLGNKSKYVERVNTN